MTTKLKNIGWVAVGAIVLYWAATTLVGTVFSGPLDPPAPPAETQKGQITSIPYTITAPGSYVVMADLTCPSCSAATDHGIQITSSNVTLDLNGFRVKGPGTSVGGSGIFVSGTRSNVTVKNGFVTDWDSTIGTGGAGIKFEDCSRCRVDHVVANGNFDGVAVLTGGAGTIKDVNATANEGGGIFVGGTGGWIVEDSLARNNSVGIAVGSNGNVIRNNVVRTNASHGIQIGFTYIGNTIEGNSVNASGNVGIRVDGTNNMIVGNNARSNSSGNYAIVASNHVGPIISGPDDPISSSNPWANHEY